MNNQIKASQQPASSQPAAPKDQTDNPPAPKFKPASSPKNVSFNHLENAAYYEGMASAYFERLKKATSPEKKQAALSNYIFYIDMVAHHKQEAAKILATI